MPSLNLHDINFTTSQNIKKLGVVYQIWQPITFIIKIPQNFLKLIFLRAIHLIKNKKLFFKIKL